MRKRRRICEKDAVCTILETEIWDCGEFYELEVTVNEPDEWGYPDTFWYSLYFDNVEEVYLAEAIVNALVTEK